MLAQDVLDLGGLDAVAAHLDLVVQPAEHFDDAVRPVPRGVAGAVEPGRRRAVAAGWVEWVREEVPRRQLRLVQIATSDPGAADVKLALNAHRDKLSRRVEHEHRRVGDRPADRDDGVDGDGLTIAMYGLATVYRRDRVGRDDAGRLRLAEHVDQPRPAARQPRPRPGQARRQRLAGEQEQPQRVVEQFLTLPLSE